MKILEQIDNLSRDDLAGRKIYDELFDVKDKISRSEIKFKLLQRAKAIGMKMHADEMIKEKEREERAKEQEELKSRSMQTVSNITNFYPDITDKSYSQMACGSWIATEEGIYSSESSSADKLACHHPIIPVRRLKNLETGKEKITLAFKRDGLWQELTVPKSKISTVKGITELSDFGIQVNENARLLIKYLSDVEMYNSDIIDMQHSTGKLGWHRNNKIFVPYDLEIVFDGEDKFRSMIASISENGDYFEWVNLMKRLRSSGKIEPRIALAASFASVLIKPLGTLPFIVDFYGQSGGGKTVTINISASVWGNPSQGEYVAGFKDTPTNIELRNDMLNNLPLILDDSKEASQKVKDDYETLIYDLCAGKGKGRSNKDLGIAKENTWKNVCICNGENPISEYADSAGAINRVIEIECSEDIYDNPSYVNDTVMKNYGFAGRVFVGYLKQKSAEELNSMFKEIEDQFDSSDIMNKQIISISAIILADKLATEAIFKDGKELTYEDVKKIPARKSNITEGQRCYEYILEILSSCSQHFDIQFPCDQWGLPLERDEEGNVYAYFYVNQFVKILKSAGYSRTAFTSWAKKRGLLRISGRDSNTRDTYSKKDGGKTVRFIAVKIIDLDIEKIKTSEDEYANNYDDINEISDNIEVPFN